MSEKDEWDLLMEQGWWAVIDVGAVYWYYRGQVHNFRELPAIEFAGGPKLWYCHGKEQDIYYPWEPPSKLEKILGKRRAEASKGNSSPKKNSWMENLVVDGPLTKKEATEVGLEPQWMDGSMSPLVVGNYSKNT